MGKIREKEKQRKLSKAEEIRKEQFDRIKCNMIEQGYKEHDLTVGIVFANIMAVLITIPIIVAFGIPFFMNNEEGTMGEMEIILFWLMFFVSIFLHEGIHGIFWSIFAKGHWKSISFGFIKEYATPYCTCTEPVKKGGYITGGLMPGIILGILPLSISIFTGSLSLFFYGAIMTVCAGGDLTICLKILFYRSKYTEQIYIDHPCEGGVVVFEK